MFNFIKSIKQNIKNYRINRQISSIEKEITHTQSEAARRFEGMTEIADISFDMYLYFKGEEDAAVQKLKNRKEILLKQLSL